MTIPGDSDDENDARQADAVWILSSTFIIFTMQSGFGLLESGSVSVKNELNIMVKNAVDVVFGGCTYWAFGYGLSFGDSTLSNSVVGWGSFLVNADDDDLGVVYSKFFFQASFATTATTIVSGAMAERTKLTSYMLFSMVNTILFCIPAHWVWSSKGWLYQLGVVDIAGAGPVHIVGGVTGLIATLMLKPRHGRFVGNKSKMPTMSSPTNAVLGMFMLWWGWLGFNCGSTFGISGLKWKLAARAAATTLCSSVAGGVAGFILSYFVKEKRFDVTYLINGVLGSLVSITAVCAIVQPWQGFVIGCIGSIITNAGTALLDKLQIDDPVGCVSTHALSGTWSLIVAGLFIKHDSLLEAMHLHSSTGGLFYGGGFRQLGIQLLACVSVIVWTICMSFVTLKIIDLTIGLRVSLQEEIIGADIVEHGIGDLVYDKKTCTVIYPPGLTDEATKTIASSLGRNNDDHIINNTLDDYKHLLGHSGRRRTVEQINIELDTEQEHEPMRYYDSCSSVGDGCCCYTVSRAKNSSQSVSSDQFGRRLSRKYSLATRLRQRMLRHSFTAGKRNVGTNNFGTNSKLEYDYGFPNPYVWQRSVSLQLNKSYFKKMNSWTNSFKTSNKDQQVVDGSHIQSKSLFSQNYIFDGVNFNTDDDGLIIDEKTKHYAGEVEQVNDITHF